jgi:hypothetical protein
VELNAHIPRVIRDLNDFDEVTLRVNAANS